MLKTLWLSLVDTITTEDRRKRDVLCAIVQKNLGNQYTGRQWFNPVAVLANAVTTLENHLTSTLSAWDNTLICPNAGLSSWLPQHCYSTHLHQISQKAKLFMWFSHQWLALFKLLLWILRHFKIELLKKKRKSLKLTLSLSLFISFSFKIIINKFK